MPTCAALGCERRGDPILKYFPRKDHRRRQIWVDRVNRPGWTPTKYSALCEHHFDRDQWELPREDGKRKLKNSALPTIFKVQTVQNVVSRDHSYCLPFYRKIYEDIDLKTDTSGSVEETMPIEHIKVEMDESGKFSSETAEEEEKEDKVVEEEEENNIFQDNFENIQCTPDISVFPEKGEPFPIEMVNCGNDNINAFVMEPDNDPLAISAEDHVQAATAKPYFGNRQKFLFIPKETKVIVNMPSKAKGEPASNSSESKFTVNVKTETKEEPKINISESKLLVNMPSEAKREHEVNNSVSNLVVNLSSGTNEEFEVNSSKSTVQVQPKLKVKNLDGLLDPNLVLKSPNNNASEISKNILRSPSALYLKEKSILPKPVTSVAEVKSSGVKTKLEIDRKVVTLTLPQFSIPSKLKLIPANKASNPKINLVSTEISIKRDPNFIRKATNLKIEKPITLSAREKFITQNHNSKNVCVIDPESKLTQSSMPKSNDSLLNTPTDTNVAFKSCDVEKANGKIEKTGENNDLQSVGKCKEMEKQLINHQNISGQGLKHLRTDVVAKEGVINNGNNNVRFCIDSNINTGQTKSDNNDLAFRKIISKTYVQKSDTPVVKSSSVIVLKPFTSLKSQSINNKSTSSNLSNLKTLRGGNRTITVYRCDQCRVPFISQHALQVHKSTTGHTNNKPEGKYDKVGNNKRHSEDCVTIETSSESSFDSLDCESTDVESSVEVLSGDDSETDSVEEIPSYLNDRSSDKSDSRTETADEEEVEEERQSLMEEKYILNQSPQPFENELLKIPDINALRSLKTKRFQRLLNIAQMRDNLQTSMGNFKKDRGLNKASDKHMGFETVFLKTKYKKLDKLAVENVDKMEENLLTHKMKPTKVTSAVSKVKGTQKSINCRGESENGISTSRDSSQENEQVSDESMQEISSESEVELSDTLKIPVVSIPKLDVNNISEHVIKKKNEYLKKPSKLSKMLNKYGSPVQPSLVKDNIREPIVLLPKMDPIICNNLKRGNKSKADSLESVSEIVISDDEDLNCNGRGILDKKNRNKSVSKEIRNTNKEREEMSDARKLSMAEVLVDLTTTNELEEEKQIQNKNPVISIPKLRPNRVKRKTIVETKRKRIKFQSKNDPNSKEDGANINNISKSPCSVASVNNRKLSCKRKTNESTTPNRENAVSLLGKVKKSESRLKNKTVRSSGKQNPKIDYETKDFNSSKSKTSKDSVLKTISEINLKRSSRNRQRVLERGNNVAVCQKEKKKKHNQTTKSKRTCASVTRRKINSKSNKEKSQGNKKLEKQYKFAQCKLCSENVLGSQIKRHVLQHTNTTSACGVCKKTFFHSVSLRRHMTIEH